MARALVLGIACLALVPAAPAHGETKAFVAVPAAAVAAKKPEITGGVDGKKAWMAAAYKGLVVKKASSQAGRTIAVDLQYHDDQVSILIDENRIVTVVRGGTAVVLSGPESIARVQELLGGSMAVFATRAMLADRETRSDLKAPEMSLLSTAAFVAALVGDTDAPRRLTTRFVEKYRGVFRPVRFAATCWDHYTGETVAAWDDLQGCMDEANQDESFLNGAYRRIACNILWVGRTESAWFQYLSCISPLAPLAQ